MPLMPLLSVRHAWPTLVLVNSWFRGDHILVGDLMRSLSLLLFKPEEGALELRAQVGGLAASRGWG